MVAVFQKKFSLETGMQLNDVHFDFAVEGYMPAGRRNVCLVFALQFVWRIVVLIRHRWLAHFILLLDSSVHAFVASRRWRSA